MKVWKVVTAGGNTELLNADTVELEENVVLFYSGDDLIGRFVSPNSFNIVEKVEIENP